MKILEGLFFINDVDVYKEYSAFLVEDKVGAHVNYNELLKPPAMKSYTAVSFREQDGENLPEELPSPCFEARDVTLYFAIISETKAGLIANYAAFFSLLKSGWLNICVPELNRTYKMYYKSCTNFDQLTYLEGEAVYASRFKVKFREPKPSVE